jgi:tetratricopeptide (TPR) repeat protein
VATALQNLGLCLSSLGEHAEARAVEAEALELGERLGNVRLQAGCHEYLAILSTRSGALDAAREHAERALVLARDLPPLRACVLATLADALRAAGEVEGALLRATEAKRIADELGALDEGEARVRLAYAEALLAAGQDGAGREAVLDAKRRIDAVAASLTDPGWRTTYLQGVPENARVTALAAAWRGA